MEHTDKTAGGWLAAAALLLIASLALHPPPESGTEAFMEQIADEGQTWVTAHWLAAAALSAFVVAGVLGASAARGPLARSAWAVLAVGAFWVVITAVAEATVVAHVAGEGDLEAFAMWEEFAAGTSMGFALLALAIAAIAAGQARAERTPVPRWSARVATGVAVVSSVAWILSMGAGIGAAAPVWLVSALLMSIWLVWYGVAVARQPAPAPRRTAAHA